MGFINCCKNKNSLLELKSLLKEKIDNVLQQTNK